MSTTPTEEAEQLVDGVVDNGRTKIVDENEQLIDQITENLDNFREFNVVVSEVRRRLEQDE